MKWRGCFVLIFLCASLCAGEPVVGETVWVGGRYFQFAGKSAAGERLYFYPHVDGVAELFTAPQAGPWLGSLDSRFDPATGRFENLFNAGEAAVEFLHGPLDLQRRRPAARVLSIFLALYDQSKAPYYLREHLATIAAALNDEDRAYVEKSVALHRAVCGRLSCTGTQLKRFATPRASLDAPEYYRRLLADGYLDITVCGGNLYAEAWGTYNSWTFTEHFCERLKKQGFLRSSFRSSNDAMRMEKTVRLFDSDILVRVTVTGGSQQLPRIMRAVANFTEGFARADALLYHGHSNKDEGAYYLAEREGEFQRFQIGMNDRQDLLAKLQGLNARQHQIFGLQSCISLEKFGYPIRASLDEHYPNATGHAGFIASPTMSQQVDFAPRYSAFVEHLTHGRGPRSMLDAMNSIRPDPHSVPLVFRGVLQPRASFIVPLGVSISSQKTDFVDGALLTQGTGSDGQTYFSTDLFPQDAPGDVIHLVALQKYVFALYADGTLFEAGASSKGAVCAAPAVRNLRQKILAISADATGERLLLLCDDNKLRAFSPGDMSIQYSPAQPPVKTIFKAIGFDAKKNFVAQDADKKWWRWSTHERIFQRLTETPDLSSSSPSLGKYGRAGTLLLKVQP